MIAKRINRSGATSSMARLIRYMVAAQGGMDPSQWKRTSDYAIDSKATTQNGEKVQSYRVTNCDADDPAVAAMLMTATQACNTRSQSDKTYHLVFSFAPGETPPLDTLHAIEDALCESIGFADHQRMSAVHVDTDHLHVHVAINKVHPTGYQNIEPFYDKQKLMTACEALEVKFGLQRTSHGVTNDDAAQDTTTKRSKTPSSKASDMMTHAGISSLEQYVRQKVGDQLRAATSWNDIHATLGQHGLTIKPRGAGLVIGDALQGVWCKASTCGSGLSFKSLTGRLGAFYEHSNSTALPENARYTPRPIKNHPASSNLFAEYQRQQRIARETRSKGLVAIQQKQKHAAQHITHHASIQRALIKATPYGAGKKALYATLSMQVLAQRQATKLQLARERQALIQQTTLPTWQAWLMQRAEDGDTYALAVLRFRAEKEEKLRGDLLTVVNAEKAKQVIMKSLKPQARKDGAMVYRTLDGGLILDRADHVQVKTTTAGAALVAATLASERFKGQKVIVEGSEQFRKDVIKLAALHRLDILFLDAAIEGKQLTTVKAATSSPHPFQHRHNILNHKKQVTDKSYER